MSAPETERVFWDTNVWVYLFDRDSPEKQEKVRRLLRSQHDRIVTSTQVLQEFYVTVTRKLEFPLDEKRGERALEGVADFCTVSTDLSMIFAAVRLSREHSFSFWDALVLEAALTAGAKVLLTEDMQEGREIRGLTIRGPWAR